MTSSLVALLTLSMLTDGQTPGVCHGVNTSPASLPSCEDEDIQWHAAELVIELRHDVVCTLSDVSERVPESALARLPGPDNVWVLRANVALSDGATLRLHGSAIGGDVDELRMLSTPERYVNIRAEWGGLDINSTRVLGWDEPAGFPDLIHEDGRAHIAVRSFLDDDDPRESRMDIRNSEIAYLGHFGDSAYGLAWRVVGTGESGSMSPVFDQVEVYGVVHNNFIHHNYMGSYTWGAYCMEWVGNEVGHNVVYGIDPHDNSDHLLIANNHVHHNGTHGIICSKNCDHLTIRNNETSHNGRHGIMLHLNISASVVEGNRSHDNGGWGIAIFGSPSNVIRGNDCYRNEYGIHIYEGTQYNVIENNVAHDNELVGIRFASGARANRVRNNWVFDNDSTGLSGVEAADQSIENNLYERIEGHDHPLEP
ncbi:MAG: right-handed parallel beta-helix repeat-containing protein [Myxococcota bacterium]